MMRCDLVFDTDEEAAAQGRLQEMRYRNLCNARPTGDTRWGSDAWRHWKQRLTSQELAQGLTLQEMRPVGETSLNNMGAFRCEPSSTSITADPANHSSADDASLSVTTFLTKLGPCGSTSGSPLRIDEGWFSGPISSEDVTRQPDQPKPTSKSMSRPGRAFPAPRHPLAVGKVGHP